MSSKRFSRRSFLAAGAAAAAGPFIRTSRSVHAATGRVIILGFDGIEPEILGEMMDRGEAPNFAAMRDKGSFRPLMSTIPPQSPVAWTSFTTCKNPGGHNIYDFIRRNPKGPGGPLPVIGTGDFEHVELNRDGSVESKPKAASFRKGRAFWSVADEQGARCKILNVPFAYPADTMKNGVQLCGLGVPDLRGYTSTFVSLSDSFSKAEEDERLSGGMRMGIEFDANDVATVRVPGPRDNRYSFSSPLAYTQTTMELKVDRNAHAGSAKIGGQTVELQQGAWSEWARFTFKMSDSYTVHGVSRFYPLEIGEQVRIYMACQQFDPANPYAPITHPDDYLSELEDRYGIFKTIGWHYDTHALRQGGLNEEGFFADVRQSMEWRAKLTLDEMDRGNFDLLTSVWTATDRVGHMFWRFRDPKHPMHDPDMAEVFGKALEESYRIADGIVGKVQAKLKPGDLFMILSDHGFGTWRTGFNVNNWLRDNGYLAVSDETRAKGGFLQGYDWANSKAYSVGLSSVYLNVRGREAQGAVAPGDADKTIAEIKEKLAQVKNPATGNKIFDAVYTRADYSGEAIDEAPDISLGYAATFQSAKKCAMGGISDTPTEPNNDKWSGEHAAADVQRLPGIFFANQAVENPKPNILDLGVTALRHLQKDVPSDYEGASLV